MGWSKEDMATDVALITTFLGDDELQNLAKKKEFQEHLVRQKRLIASLLKTGFELTGEHLTESEKVQFEEVKKELVVNIAPEVKEPEPPVERPSDLLEGVTQIFADKTGYPEDMLEPELDLEGDLGIDTIKQMEILAEIRKMFGLQKDENFSLKQTPSISAIVEYIESL